MAYDEKLAARVRDRLLTLPGFSERKMFGGLCFLLNGHMCCGIVGDDLMLRVGPDTYEAALERKGARPMDFTGQPLRGMVYVAPEALRSARGLEGWLALAIAFVQTLGPRPARKKAVRTRRGKAARL